MARAHRYGERVRLCEEPYLLSLLARIGSPETTTESVPGLVRSCYQYLTHRVLDEIFPVTNSRVATRMAATEPRAFYEGPRLCQNTKLVICSVIRAGILPAQVCYEAACEALPAANVRLDFLNMSRELDETGQVTGVRMEGSKIGGPVAGTIVLIPDPMGATGGTVQRAVETYRTLDGGPPRAIAAAHLMVTPEAIGRLTEATPELDLFAGRLDRGLSPVEVLETEPGTHPARERGLNEVQYIVPGAGGMGELPDELMGVTRTSDVALLLLAASACEATAPRFPEHGIDALGWLEGHWTGTTGDGVAVEACYSSADGGMIVAATKEISSSGALAMFDFEFIMERDGALFMRPYPFGKRSVDFPLVELDAAQRRAVFQNPDHDFPQRFDYFSPHEDRLVITLDGEMGGSPTRARYTLSRRR